MKKPWFKAKSNGLGWVPASREGWAVTLVYAAVLAWSIGRFTNFIVEHVGEPFLGQVFPILLHTAWVSALVASFLYICLKSGERLEWRA